jgi:DnaK suppressor protein
MSSVTRKRHDKENAAVHAMRHRRKNVAAEPRPRNENTAEREPGAAAWDPPRKRLLELRSRFSHSAARMAETSLNGHGTDTSSVPLDTGDFASETCDQDVVVDLLGSAKSSLDQINEALARLEEGNYGRCEDCGCEIPSARLEALPYTALCVNCAATRERDGR